MNARSIVNKISDLEAVLNPMTYAIVAVCETWLSKDILDDEILADCPNFVITRKDRLNKRGGGVAIFINKDIKFIPVFLDNDNDDLEICAIDLFIPSKHRFICIYREPRAPYEYLESLVTTLHHLCNVSHPVTIVGDFNFPLIDWNFLSYPQNLHYNCFMECVNELGLHQLVDFGTRNENILDLVFCTSSIIVSQVRPDECFSNSDHLSINFCISGIIDKRINTTEHHFLQNYDFRKTDFVQMTNYLSLIDWENELNSVFSVDKKWELFMNIIKVGCELFVPKKSFKNGCSDKIRYHGHIQRLIKRKARLWKQSRISRNFTLYKICSETCSKEIVRFKKNREHKLLNNGDKNSVFKHVKKKI